MDFYWMDFIVKYGCLKEHLMKLWTRALCCSLFASQCRGCWLWLTMMFVGLFNDVDDRNHLVALPLLRTLNTCHDHHNNTTQWTSASAPCHHDDTFTTTTVAMTTTADLHPRVVWFAPDQMKLCPTCRYFRPDVLPPSGVGRRPWQLLQTGWSVTSTKAKRWIWTSWQHEWL